MAMFGCRARHYQLATTGVQRGGVPEHQEVPPGLLGGLQYTVQHNTLLGIKHLQGALGDEEVSDEELLTRLLRILHTKILTHADNP